MRIICMLRHRILLSAILNICFQKEKVVPEEQITDVYEVDMH